MGRPEETREAPPGGTRGGQDPHELIGATVAGDFPNPQDHPDVGPVEVTRLPSQGNIGAEIHPEDGGRDKGSWPHGSMVSRDGIALHRFEQVLDDPWTDITGDTIREVHLVLIRADLGWAENDA